MNLKHLPSADLSKIAFKLAAKLVAYNTMSAFRGNLGEEHIAYNVKQYRKGFFYENYN